MTLPTDSTERKHIPMFTGLLAYFPDAFAAVAKHSWVSNEQHNPGEPLHWSREKSNDHKDCIVRHMTDIAAHPGDLDYEVAELCAVVWRGAAALQLAIEAQRKQDAAERAGVATDRCVTLPEEPQYEPIWPKSVAPIAHPEYEQLNPKYMYTGALTEEEFEANAARVRYIYKGALTEEKNRAIAAEFVRKYPWVPVDACNCPLCKEARKAAAWVGLTKEVPPFVGPPTNPRP